jgi:hypothetical protein
MGIAALHPSYEFVRVSLRHAQCRRVGKAQRAHHLATRLVIDGGHVASLLCPPYAAVNYPNSPFPGTWLSSSRMPSGSSNRIE